ncbi:hypothetical protein SAMN05444920_12232 [Nonomuraea solani]|uniref:Uncharacterized protein n=2 Tax=Nonomuraea solani TaxID=1144553 RepID=A0A1H6EWI1_9ACTN|nr:hypothetical protein SAMN05444920_12232 [Nonomuraea solani]
MKVPEEAAPADNAVRDQNPQAPDSGGEGEALPSGAARAEALDAAALTVVEDMWPLNGAQVGSLTPTLVAHATNGTAPYTYLFSLCASPDGEESASDPSTWCSQGNLPISSGYLPAGVNTWKVPAGKLKWGTTYAWQVTVGAVTSAYRVLVTRRGSPPWERSLPPGARTARSFIR